MTVLDRGVEDTTLPSQPPALTSRVATGVRWGLFNQLVQQVTRMLVTIALTRLLDPRRLRRHGDLHPDDQPG